MVVWWILDGGVVVWWILDGGLVDVVRWWCAGLEDAK